ncbi:MAG TPA: MFS transporter [Streptosporangiaceae bacterium]|nr:MFS transporter [Streptosporangiaceae bacterium]
MDNAQKSGASASGGALALALAAVALLAVTMGTRSVFGLFLSPLNSASGLGVATISFAIAVSQLSWGVAQPFAGILAERIGAARVIAGGTLLAAAVGAILPFAHSASMLVAVFALGGVAATVGAPSLLIGTVSQRVPAERRGMVAGLIGAGGPLGQLVLAPATQAMMLLAGWVDAALALAGLTLASLPLALFFRRPAAPAPSAAEAAATVRTALASPHYWTLNATFFVCGLHVFFLMTHLPGVIELCGLPSSVSGLALAALGLFNIAGSIAAGLLIQRCSMKRTLASLYAARGIGVALFIVAPKTELTVLAFSAWMGLTYMAVLPPTAGLIGRVYGARRLATLLGITFMVHQAGAFIGAWLGGVVLERTGSYDLMWRLDLSLAAVAAAVSLAVRERPIEAGPAGSQGIAPALRRESRAAASWSVPDPRRSLGGLSSGAWARAPLGSSRRS